jgi:UDPglucose 6-dehydrogenase
VIVERLRRRLDPDGARIVVLGAAFKPGTDDVRESPALEVVRQLRAAGATVVVHDPIALRNFTAALADGSVLATEDLREALTDADAVVLLTAWPAYDEVPALLDGRDTLVVDGRRMLSSAAVARYDGVGYPTSART